MKNAQYWRDLAEGYETISRETLKEKLSEDFSSDIVESHLKEIDCDGFINLFFHPGIVQIVFVRENVYRAV